MYVSVTVFTCAAALLDMLKTLPEGMQNAMNVSGLLAFAGEYLPFFSINLGWVLPAAIGLGLGLVIHFVRKKPI